jgi:hypothetical protein
MQVLHAVTEHQMVAAFLPAELNSPRWREHVINGLDAQGRKQSLIEHPDLQSDLDNDVRVQVLLCIRQQTQRLASKISVAG